MQWILMFLGGMAGGVLGDYFGDVLIGALAGCAVAQALRLSALEAKYAVQQRALTQAAQALAALGQPLDAHTPAEASETPPTQEPQPVPASIPASSGNPAALAAGATEPAISPPAPEPGPTPPALPNEPAAPYQPGLTDRLLDKARAWLFGGNTVLRVGLVLLFLGLAFLLRYATDNLVVPLELRYAGVAVAALGLLGLGWRLRLRNRPYGLTLQGAGIAVLYLTVFAAMRLHPLIALPVGFGLLVTITVLLTMLAVRQDALALAATAALGGFMSPILASTGSGNHVALFSYFVLLNSGIFAIAWFKAWRLLNLIGFVCTFSIGLAWGLRSYTPALLMSTEPFLLLFFLMYLLIGLLFVRRRLRDAPIEQARADSESLTPRATRAYDAIDGAMLFGPPLAGFGLQTTLVQHIPYATAISALALGLLYLGLARGLARSRIAPLRDICLALGIIFASLSIPLALDASWTSAAWAVEGAGMWWLGLRQRRVVTSAFALLLQAGAACAFLIDLRPGHASLLAGPPLGALLLGLALLFSFLQLRRHHATISPRAWVLQPLLAVPGLCFLLLLAPLLCLSVGTALIWALAAPVILWTGQRLSARSFLYCALITQLAAGALWMLGAVWTPRPDATSLLRDVPFHAALALMLGGYATALRLRDSQAAVFQAIPLRRVSDLSLAWSVCWWGVAMIGELGRYPSFTPHALLLLAAVSAGLCSWLAHRLRWASLALVGNLPVPGALLLLVSVLALDPGWSYQPLADLGWLAWPLLFAAHGFSLRRLNGLLPPAVASAVHALGVWMALCLLTLELGYLLSWLSVPDNAWRWLCLALAPSLYLLYMAAPRRWRWPVAADPRAYRVHAALPLAFCMLAGFWLLNTTHDGAAWPLPYLPVLNPLELGLLLTLYALYRWSRGMLAAGILAAHGASLIQGVTGASLLALCTMLVMRTVHHWSGVPYQPDALLASTQVQAGLSLTWTLIALALMIVAHLRARRTVWLIGATLIAVVVIKLFFVELDNQGSLARIVSFIGVGALLLVVGYFAPLPPKRSTDASTVDAATSRRDKEPD